MGHVISIDFIPKLLLKGFFKKNYIHHESSLLSHWTFTKN